ncbi:minor capsid protein [Streptomyces sp. CC224B]|uniref:minor capsid protein n=1 Tax=Streptomyces sp. CC224B TaxID=3044571 RepID=UPI0024A89459|nr:minor capsid protein [Streptomyces sp. CC224B]
MTFLPDVVDGLARLLDAQSVGTYRPDGLYAAGETAITDTVMPEAPDRVIVLTAYAVEESAALTDTVLAVQVRTRAGPDPREVAALDDAVFAVLQGLGRHTFGAAHVTFVYRFSSASFGADANGRQERTSNYRVRGHRSHPRLE